MARPREHEYLHDIQPESIALDVAKDVAGHVLSFSDDLAPAALATSMPSDEALAASSLAALVRRLTIWAQSGDAPTLRGPTDEVVATKVAAALAHLLDVLNRKPRGGARYWGSKSAPRFEGIPVLDTDPSTRIAMVVAAVRSRLKLLRGEDLSMRELAAVAGLSASHVRRVIAEGSWGFVVHRAGEGKRGRKKDEGRLGGVPAAEAVRFLLHAVKRGHVSADDPATAA